MPILVGLWPEDDRTVTDAAVQALVGADAYASTLRQAVQACLAAATGEDFANLAVAA